MSDSTTVVVADVIAGTVTGWVEKQNLEPKEMVKRAMGSVKSAVSKLTPEGHANFVAKSIAWAEHGLSLAREHGIAVSATDLEQVEKLAETLGVEIAGFDPAEIAQQRASDAYNSLVETLGEAEAKKVMRAFVNRK